MESGIKKTIQQLTSVEGSVEGIALNEVLILNPR